MSSGDGRRALEILRRYRDKYPSGSFRPEATAIRIETLMKLDREGEARVLAARFVAENRGSLLAARVAELVGLTNRRGAPESPIRASERRFPSSQRSSGGCSGGTRRSRTRRNRESTSARHPGGRQLDGRAEAGCHRRARRPEGARSAPLPGRVSEPFDDSRPTSAEAHGRAVSRDHRRRSGQASRLAASSVKDAVPPDSEQVRRARRASRRRRSRVPTVPSRSSAAMT